MGLPAGPPRGPHRDALRSGHGRSRSPADPHPAPGSPRRVDRIVTCMTVSGTAHRYGPLNIPMLELGAAHRRAEGLVSRPMFDPAIRDHPEPVLPAAWHKRPRLRANRVADIFGSGRGPEIRIDHRGAFGAFVVCLRPLLTRPVHCIALVAASTQGEPGRPVTADQEMRVVVEGVRA